MRHLNEINLKLLGILLLSIFGVLAIGAQELTVKSFNPAPFDLAAASKPVIDYNGVACGLVKVRLASEGAEFEGNVMQPVEFKAGEYWVYMTKGSYKLKIKHPKFIPLDISFRDYGVRGVESNCTYELTLLMPNSASNSSLPVPVAVDLGLSVKWASFNLGARSQEEYGNYYAWGATNPETKYKEGYDSKYPEGSTLNPEDDAAAVNLGGKWRMPTFDEIKELKDKCRFEWTSVNGISGARITGPNGNSIFFPATGYYAHNLNRVVSTGDRALYWSSTAAPNPRYKNETHGRDLYFYTNVWGWASSNRHDALTIRPVLPQ